ncbi:AbrB family transcriptional regulator [Sinorhizobium meliloti]|uniref:AbrB family transcriptional regulator n=1 Tax=Rhizobium meliloti TaxID=382 RepID=UPI000B49DA38|nr:hypothetical protein CDO25_19010 [Sinorhizobium meliloti]MQX56099.1 hypothetical protein [Sinorhizobium meliloti]
MTTSFRRRPTGFLLYCSWSLFALILLIGGALYYRLIAGRDRREAAFAAMPGGLSQIVLSEDARHRDSRFVSSSHTARIAVSIAFFMVVISFFAPDVDPSSVSASPANGNDEPVLRSYLSLVVIGTLGWMVGSSLRLPAAALLGPLLLSAMVNGFGIAVVQPPASLVLFAQIIFGATIGCKFLGTSFREAAIAVSHGSVFFLFTTLPMLVVGTFVSSALDIPLIAVLLAFSPGGAVSASFLALESGVNPGYVAAHHCLRLLLVTPLIALLGSSSERSASRR